MSLWITWKRHHARLLSKYSPTPVYAYVRGVQVGRYADGKKTSR